MIRERNPTHDDSIVRNYRADGTLTVTRDDDANEHVIESRGHDPGDKWTRRVPATRTTVDQDERLWSIPDNWTHRYTLKAEHGPNKGIYDIAETTDSVLVSLCHHNDRITDAFHLVERVGETTWTAHVEIDQDALCDALTHLNNHPSGFPEGVCDVLEYLRDNPRDAVAEAEETAEMCAPEHVEHSPSIPMSAFDPFQVTFRSENRVVNHPTYGSHTEVMKLVHELLADFEVVPPSPLVSVTVQ